jgi:poly-gamma-glutamate synthesis protein (capsule biosynthesis protein)
LALTLLIGCRPAKAPVIVTPQSDASNASGASNAATATADAAGSDAAGDALPQTADAATDGSGVSTATPDVRIVCVGDMTFSRSGARSMGDPDDLLAAVRKRLADADITYGNLETPLSSRGKPADKQYTFRGPISAAAALARAGFDVVSVANNHSLDYGRTAFADTIDALEDAGVTPVGGGADRDAAWAPVIVKANGARVAFLAFSEITPVDFAATSTRSGCAYTQDFAAVRSAVKAAAQTADYTVVAMHWGIENNYTPTARQVKEGRALIKAGADAVLASHPHVLQGVEFYRDGLIAYSMGNFVFSPGAASGRDSAILHLTLTADGVDAVSATPVHLDTFAPKPQKGASGKRVLKILKKGSVARGTQVSINDAGSRATFKPK